MNRPEFVDILKIDKSFFQVLKVSCLLQELIVTPSFLGYLMGDSWGTPTMITQKRIDFLKLNLVCCVTDICQ
jgi:hypothetical protein